MAMIRKFDFGKESAEDRADANRQTASLAGLAIALFLVVVGLFVFRALHAKAIMEDCLMSGQRSCSEIIIP